MCFKKTNTYSTIFIQSVYWHDKGWNSLQARTMLQTSLNNTEKVNHTSDFGGMHLNAEGFFTKK